MLKKGELIMNITPLNQFFKTTQQILFILCITLLNNALALENNNRLEKIGFSTMPGNRVQIKLNFADQVVTPSSFSTENPARIVLDFPATELSLKKKSQPIGVGAVQSTNAVETSDRSRIVINLVRLVPFKVTVKDSRVLV